MINRHALGYHDGLNNFPVENLAAGSSQEKPGCLESGEEYMAGHREGVAARQQIAHQAQSRKHILA